MEMHKYWFYKISIGILPIKWCCSNRFRENIEKATLANDQKVFMNMEENVNRKMRKNVRRVFFCSSAMHGSIKL